jgi:methylated-DNA-[protein]-cysteine S-methyltransferase
MPDALMSAILEPPAPLNSGSVECLESERVTGTDFTRYAVPGWGAGELWAERGVVVAHDFLFGSVAGVEESARGGLPARFAAFLAGEPDSFDDVEIDLSWATPFQRATAEALRGVPRGEVVSYGELAALAGYPGAARAVGTFCAGNRFAFLVPCHRVVAANGIGGYGPDGNDVKRRLLALEGATW